MRLASPLRFTSALVLALAPLVALDAPPSPPQSPATITYTFDPSAAATSAIAGTPLIDLGVSGAPAETFNRIATVKRQSSGQVIVANGNPAELRVFDDRGRHVRTIGRPGQGPGEYAEVADVVVRRGDSLVVLDRRARRITLLGPDGAIASTIRFQQPFATSPYSATINALDDGTLLIGYGLVTATEPSPEPVIVPQIVGRYSAAGVRLDSVGAFFTGENFYQAAPRNMGGFAFWDRTFGRRGAIIATGNTFIAGDASAMEVRRHARTGALVEVHRVDVARKPVTPADIERHKRLAMAGPADRDRTVDRKRIDEMPYPTHFPAYARFMVDARGRFWLQEYQYPAAGDLWLVLDPKTREAKKVRLPDRFVAYEIGATDIVGVWRDADDVEHVRVYRLAA